MKLRENPNGDGFFLDLSKEEEERLRPFLNRYGFLDRFPQEDYPNGYPREVTIYDWMFPEHILVSTKQSEEAKK